MKTNGTDLIVRIMEADSRHCFSYMYMELTCFLVPLLIVVQSIVSRTGEMFQQIISIFETQFYFYKFYNKN